MSTLDREPQKLLRFTMLVHRVKGMSEDDFHEHWSNRHQAIVKEWLQKHGCVKYVQVSVLC